jgi:hypothetical protein
MEFLSSLQVLDESEGKLGILWGASTGHCNTSSGQMTLKEGGLHAMETKSGSGP